VLPREQQLPSNELDPFTIVRLARGSMLCDPKTVEREMKSQPGPPMTLGNAAARSEAEGGTSADPAEMARRYDPETTIPDWHKRLVCSRCGSRRRRLALRRSHDTDMVLTGTERR
jgi:hypothetical protein